jgi:surface protein
MPVVTVSTLGGGDIAIDFPDGRPLTTTDLVRELATRVPNHRSTFLLCVNDSEYPVEGLAPDADLTTVVDTTKDVTLLFRPYEAFATGDELTAAVREWTEGGERQVVVSERFGHRIGDWDVSRVTDMNGLFCGALAFNDDVSGWDTSNVTDMRNMFGYAVVFDGDVSGWDTSRVIYMGGMFCNALAFRGDVSGWDVSNVTGMAGMFDRTGVFNGDLSGWDTSSVTTMRDMFNRARAFDGDISGWDTSRVTDMRQMFWRATAFDGDVSGWDTSRVIHRHVQPICGAQAFNDDVSG